MDWKTFIVKIFEAGVWPFVVVAALVLYQHTLPDFLKSILSKVKLAKFKDAEIHFSSQSESKPESLEEASKLEELTPKDATGLQKRLEEIIEEQLKPFGNNENKINLLVSNLAHSQSQAFFERVDYTIFGSQLRLLEYLNSKAGGPLNDIEAKEFYNSGLSQNPKLYETYDFHKYMGYLENMGLIRRAPDGWRIEDAGQAFLMYMAQPGRSKNKPN